MKKSICFLSPKSFILFDPEVKSAFGGAEVSLYVLSKQIAEKENIRIHFITADYGRLVTGAERKIIISRSFEFGDNFIIKAIKFLKAYINSEAEVFIEKTLNTFSGIIALISFMRKKKFVYMVACDHELDGRYEKETGRIRSFFAKLVFRYSSMIIVQTNKQKELLEKIGNKKVKVIRSGVEILDLPKETDGSVLWVSRAVRHKRPGVFIELAKRNPSVEFTMISKEGFGEKDFYERIQKEAADADNLTFIGHVDFDKIHEYYAKAKVFVNTSDMEGFPFSFLQAAAAKTPIVSLEIDPDNFIKTYNCGFDCGGDPDELDKGMNLLLSDERLYKKMSANIFEYVSRFHNINDIADEFVSSINSI